MTHQLFINEEQKELLWNRGTVNLTDRSEVSWKKSEVIKILLSILHIALVVLCALNTKATKLKLSKLCWAFSSVIWAILLANDIFKFM